MRLANVIALDDSNFTARGIEYQQNKRGPKRIIRWSWALRIVVKAAQSLRRPLPENVASMRPRPLFPSRYGGNYSARGFKTAWQRCMGAYRKAGNEGFWEHDIRAKSSSDASTDQRAAELLGDTVETARKHYRRAPAKVRPLR